VSFCRIDDRPIRIREPISQPDALVVQDPTLVHQVRLFDGVGSEAFVLLNTSRSFAELVLGELEERLRGGRALCVPATDVARRVLGRPLPNTALSSGGSPR
jgi:pyruvate ferredoxin oxidoreductase gamma subunit